MKLNWRKDKIFENEKLSWLNDENVRPYIFVRPDNRVAHPGRYHRKLKWFRKAKPIYKNPLEMGELGFADQIMELEARAFGPSGMQMPRWVFYDCAIVPGILTGFAARTSALPPLVKEVLGAKDSNEWTPLSLFIIIPTVKEGEWVAHNLCSVNSLLPKQHQYYGIGFISKAFGLWYANVRTCCGITQWMSPSIRLHAHYGDFEVLTSWTPAHSYARTLTYRLTVNSSCWHQFFSKEWPVDFDRYYKASGFMLDPKDDKSLQELQHKLERAEGPFFLSGQETVEKDLSDPLTVYRPT